MIKSSSDYTLQTCHHLLDGLSMGFASSKLLVPFITHSLSMGQTSCPMQTNGLGRPIPNTLVPYDESDYKCLVHGDSIQDTIKGGREAF